MNKDELVELITKAYPTIVNMIYLRYGEDLSDYRLRFDIDEGKAFANCNNVDKLITFYVLGNRYEGSTPETFKNYVLETIIHELAHAICYRYELDLGDNNIYFMMFRDSHNITFALVCYCLQREILGKKWDFYHEYDFHEEEQIEKLLLDCMRVARIVRKTKFNSVLELAAQAKFTADLMRVKYLKTKTTPINTKEENLISMSKLKEESRELA